MIRSWPRIAVSGPSGAGKSTLVKTLAAELSVPVIEEDMVPIYDAQLAYKRLSQHPASPPEEQSRALAAWMRSYFDWCEARGKAYAQHAGFVADRWELDAFGYWLQTFIPYRPDAETRRLHQIFLSRAQALDLVVILPVGDFEAGERNEAGLRRVKNYNTQLLTQTNFTGLLHQVPASVARYAPLTNETVEKRVATILRIVRALPDSQGV